ncbi:MAG: hypothetical protein ABI874_13850, partial [Chloroflexota bacterium]
MTTPPAEDRSATERQLRALRDELARIETQRDLLSDALVAQMLAPLREQIATLEAHLTRIDTGGGALIGGDAKAGRDFVGRDQQNAQTIINADQVTLVQAPTTTPAPLSPDDALSRYLNYLIDAHQYLRLQGIRSAGQLLSIDLEEIYITLTATRRAPAAAFDEKLDGAERESPDAFARMERLETNLPVQTALAEYRRLVVLGAPGSGKSTLLAYCALTYARDRRDGTSLVPDRLTLDERGRLPVLLPLRDFARSLPPARGTDGPRLLLDYLREYFANQGIVLPETFFETYLNRGGAVLLLD